MSGGKERGGKDQGMLEASRQSPARAQRAASAVSSGRARDHVLHSPANYDTTTCFWPYYHQIDPVVGVKIVFFTIWYSSGKNKIFIDTRFIFADPFVEIMHR